MKKSILLLVILFFRHTLWAQVEYPYPVKTIPLSIEQNKMRFAYMDVSPERANGKSIVLLHGKNFNGYYWKDVIPFLNNLGYRVIVPDQLGFGESSKPDIHYSFHQLATNTKTLLDSLHINKVSILGHSMGGMLAVRFAIMYPSITDLMILENPIGLEDYRTFVPFVTIDSLYKEELSSTYESYKKYQQSYYPTWKSEYEAFVEAQAKSLTQPDFPQTAWANALTYQMIYEQPVCYEFKNVKAKTLIIIGQEDRTIVGKTRVSKELLNIHGQYPIMGKQIHEEIKESTLVQLTGVGHIPHIQELETFKKHVISFLNSKK